MRRILLIGAGNIGTRHLQGLFGLEEKSEIYVYDTSRLSLEKCKDVFNKSDISEKLNVTFSSTYSIIPNKIDLAIIATTANVRRTVIEYLAQTFSIKHFILEKVLFQKKEDFYAIENLLHRKRIKAWVNCPMRTYPSFIQLKKELRDIKKFSIEVRGGNWGLCCNAIHFLDLISFLADDATLKIERADYDDNLLESKRQGFFELSGSIEGSVGDCTDFCITEYRDNQMPRMIIVKSKLFNCLIIENEKKIYKISEKSNWQIEVDHFDIPYQSQITYQPVNQIFKTGECNLPTYEQSMKEHIELFESMEVQFKKLGIGGGICPIT